MKKSSAWESFKSALCSFFGIQKKQARPPHVDPALLTFARLGLLAYYR